MTWSIILGGILMIIFIAAFSATEDGNKFKVMELKKPE